MACGRGVSVGSPISFGWYMYLRLCISRLIACLLPTVVSTKAILWREKRKKKKVEEFNSLKRSMNGASDMFKDKDYSFTCRHQHPNGSGSLLNDYFANFKWFTFETF